MIVISLEQSALGMIVRYVFRDFDLKTKTLQCFFFFALIEPRPLSSGYLISQLPTKFSNRINLMFFSPHLRVISETYIFFLFCE